MRDLEAHGVNLLLACQELRQVYDNPKVSHAVKCRLIEAFKRALRDRLGFPPDVLQWDHDAVMLYAGCIVEIG